MYNFVHCNIPLFVHSYSIINNYEVGKEIRKTIKKLGGTMPEDLPIPDKSLKELEKESKKLSSIL